MPAIYSSAKLRSPTRAIPYNLASQSVPIDRASLTAIGLTAFLAVLSGLDAPFLIRIPIFVAIFFAVLRNVVVSSKTSHPIYILIQVWVVGFAARSLAPVIALRPYPNFIPFSYIIVVITLALIGAVFKSPGAHTCDRSPSDIAFELRGQVKRYLSVLDLAAIGGFVASFSFSYEMLSLNNIDFSDLAQTRVAFFTKQATIFTYITLLTRVGGAIALFAGIFFREHLSKWRITAYLASGLSLSALALFSAGRFLVLQILMTVMFALALRRLFGMRALPRMQIRVVLPALALGCLLFGYMFYVTANRDRRAGYGEESYRYLLVSAGYEVDPSFKPIFDELPTWAKGAIVAAYSYGGIPFDHFGIFWHIHDAPLALGGFECQILSRNLHRLFPSIPSGDDQLQQAYDEFISNGEPGFTWQTAIRDAIADFGKPGTMILMIFFGIWSASAFQKVVNDCSLPRMLQLMGFWMLAFHSGMYSLLGEAAVLFLIFLPPFARRFRKSKPMNLRGLGPEDRKLYRYDLIRAD